LKKEEIYVVKQINANRKIKLTDMQRNEGMSE
jgi:hypothetical protein